MDKVKVSKNQAKSIDHLKLHCMVTPLSDFLNGTKTPSDPKHRSIFNELKKDEIISAIFDGYDIKLTPLEMIQEWYGNTKYELSELQKVDIGNWEMDMKEEHWEQIAYFKTELKTLENVIKIFEGVG